MPRQPRLDAPGALHHVMVRGIERRAIFLESLDYDDFVRRLGLVCAAEGLDVLGWALMPNHVHLLVRSGSVPLAGLMRRLLTGYAVGFNRRHDRHGHLFQNRYKSILCEEEEYLLELVRYVHLNPLRALLVGTLEELDEWAYTGHCALMGTVEHPWQVRAPGQAGRLFRRMPATCSEGWRPPIPIACRPLFGWSSESVAGMSE